MFINIYAYNALHIQRDRERMRQFCVYQGIIQDIIDVTCFPPPSMHSE